MAKRIALFLLVLAAIVFMLHRFARQSLYPAPPFPVGEPPRGFTEVRLALRSGAEVVAWSAGEENPPHRPGLLFLHGNGENLGTLETSGSLEQLRSLGALLLVPDYPGYGRSGGRPSEESLVEAAESGLSWLADRAGERPLVVCGWSLGAAVGLQVAARRPREVDGLALLSAWSSLHAVASHHFPDFLVRWLVRERYDSLAAAPQVEVPTLVIHGAADRIIPSSQGEAVASRLPALRDWIPLRGAGHNDLLAQPRVWNELRRFLDTLDGEGLR